MSCPPFFVGLRLILCHESSTASRHVHRMDFILAQVDLIEGAGLIFGLLSVLFLIRQSIWTWPTGIAYVFISFYIFFTARLYADLVLHVFFLWMNIYGWYYWVFGSKDTDDELPVTTEKGATKMLLLVLTVFGIALCGFLLSRYTDASLPYWDSTTTVVSLSAMWLTARKKIESWHLWFFVDVLATGIYYYKELYFYSVLYLIYIGLAISGYLAWRKTMKSEQPGSAAMVQA